jgi:hypothetical protein
MRKIILVATVIAFASTGFVSSAFAKSACDPVSNPKACKSVVHHKTPKASICKIKDKKKCPKK